MAANMILDTSHNTEQVKKMVLKAFSCNLGLHLIIFCIFKNCVQSKFSLCQITGKRKGLELTDVISANINMTILNILSPNLSLYDLQKPRYIHGAIAATPKKGRGHFELMPPYRNFSLYDLVLLSMSPTQIS